MANIAKIRVSDLANAVDKALEVTFAKDFNMYKKGCYRMQILLLVLLI
jgi:hypothetical protein